MGSEDNREIMDIDYETDIHCFRLMPHGKTLLAISNSQGMCKGCRFDPNKCVINQLLAKQQIDMFRLALKNNFDEVIDKILEDDKDDAETHIVFPRNAGKTAYVGKMMGEKDLDISELGLSTRTYRCLRRAGYDRLSQLMVLSYDRLCCIRNVGKKSADEIWQVIEKYRRDTK